MANAVQNYGVNANGEVVVAAGTGSNVITGFMPTDYFPVDAAGRILMRLPASTYDSTNVNITGGTIAATGNIGTSAYVLESAVDNLTAFAGGGQAGAVLINSQTARVSTVATSGDSVKLPPSVAGLEMLIINHGQNPMQVFASGSELIDDLPAATGVSQMQQSLVIYSCSTVGNWYTNGIGTGYAGSFPTVSSKNGYTAFATGGQASATPITACINRVTTVAAAGDSMKLPASFAGMQIVVSNAGVASMNLFPAVGDNINGAGVNVAFAIPVNKTASLSCAVSGQWHAVLGA